VVLDLVVEPAEHEGGESTTRHIAGRDHLPAGKANLGVVS